MKYLIYVSTSYKLLSQAYLLEILSVSRKSNQERSLTGMLLSGEGTFIQVLESEDATLKQIYKAIAYDARIKASLRGLKEKLLNATFPEWSMRRFKSVSTGELAELALYQS